MQETHEHHAGRLALLESIINALPSPMFYKDANGVYRDCNSAFCELIIGLPRHEIIGKTLFDLPNQIPRDLAETYFRKDNELLARGGTQSYVASVHCADGTMRTFQFYKIVHCNEDGRPEGIAGVMLDITERVLSEERLTRQKEELDLLLSSISSIIIGVSIKDRVTHWNKFAEEVFGIPKEQVFNKLFAECGIQWDWQIIYEAIADAVMKESTVRIDDLRYKRVDGREGLLGLTINPLLREGTILEGFLVLGRDLTERRNLEHQLLQARKLESLGQLAAGIAHEINSPLQYVGDNLKFIAKGTEKFIECAKKHSLQSTEIEDISYLFEELPKAIAQSLEGVERVAGIIKSMKAFAHPGSGHKVPCNLNRAIENTVTVSRNQWKYECDTELSLDETLPPVPCFENEFNQVLLNLIINAVDAIVEAKAVRLLDRGIIRITSTRKGNFAVVRVEDNGTGIPEGIRDRIFDPFFTTKDVGKGTGQGLAIAHSIIVQKHGGLLYLDSEYKNGAAFVIQLPLET